MTCEAGQTDINAATAAALGAALNVDKPTAERVIGLRPYLAVKDLLVVQGIGPSRLAEIQNRGNACAATPSSPPPAPSPCATTDKVDLQSATADQVARVTGVNKSAAAAVVAARPFATLLHVTPERVPGVGKGILDTVASRSCLTPMPVRDTTASWRWAYPAYATTVTRGQFALAVPVGVIDATSGAWASITPTNAPDVPILLPEDPAADMHIWGTWANGTDTVVVTLPPAGHLDELPSDVTWMPLLKHIPTDGSAGQIVHPTVDSATGNLSAQTTSLSFWSSFYALTDTVLGTFLAARFPAPSCSAPWTQQPGTSDYVAGSQPTHVVISDSQLNLPGNNPTPVGFLVKHCVQSSPDQSGSPPYAAARSVLLDNSGAVYTVRDGVANHTRSLDPVNFLSWFTNTATAITALTASRTAPDAVLFAPGDRIAIDTPAGTHGETQVTPSALLTIERGLIDALIGGAFDYMSVLNSGDQQQIVNMLGVIGGCLKDVFPAIAQLEGGAAAFAAAGAKALYSCVMTDGRLATLLDFTFQAIARAAANLTVDQAGTIGKQLKRIEEANKYLALANFATNIIDLDVVLLTRSDFSADHYRPAPTVDSAGRPVQAICLRDTDSVAPTVDEGCQTTYYSDLFLSPTGGGGDTGLLEGYINQDAAHHSWLITNPDTTIRDITTPGDYVCWAQAGYPVRFYTDISGLNGFTHDSAPATCTGAAGTIHVTPELMDSKMVNAQGGTSNTIRLLRSASTGQTYIYVGNGAIAQVLGEEQLQCWSTGTHKYMAFDFVSDADLALFDYHPEYVEHCNR